jgi:hypothetical protein
MADLADIAAATTAGYVAGDLSAGTATSRLPLMASLGAATGGPGRRVGGRARPGSRFRRF